MEIETMTPEDTVALRDEAMKLLEHEEKLRVAHTTAIAKAVVVAAGGRVR